MSHASNTCDNDFALVRPIMVSIIDVGVRIQVLVYLELGLIPAQIEATRGVSKSAVYGFGVPQLREDLNQRKARRYSLSIEQIRHVHDLCVVCINY